MLVFPVACGRVSDRPAGRGDEEPAPSWRVDPAPITEVAGETANGDLNFQFARGATRLSDGTIVIADGYDRSVRFFDTAGRLLRSVGREGRGPGEFGTVWWIGQCGRDTIYVWDYMQEEMTVLDRAGRVTSEYRLPGNAMGACSRAGMYAGFAEAGEIQPPHPRAGSPAGTLWIGDARGEKRTPVGILPLGEVRPLGRMTRLAVGKDRLYVGTADSAYVETYSFDGSLLGAFPAGITGRRPSQQNVERSIEEMVAVFSNREMRERNREFLRELPPPHFLAPYSALLSDPDGTLWVVTSAPGNSSTRLLALSESGQVLGEVEVQRELTVHEVGRDYVLGVYTDEGGEQHVVVYRLRRG